MGYIGGGSPIGAKRRVDAQLGEVKMVWRWLLVLALLIISLWIGNLALGYIWAASSPARTDFNPKPYLHLANVSMSLFGVFFISFVVLSVMNIRKSISKKKSQY